MVQITDCPMFELLYLLRTTALIFVVHNYSIVNVGYRFLNILKGIRLLVAPVLILNSMWSLAHASF